MASVRQLDANQGSALLGIVQSLHTWKDQSMINNMLVDMRMALLFHYNMDLAAVMHFLGGEHITSHQDPDVILPQVEGLVSSDIYNALEHIMWFGAPAKFN
jgi:hypothetical protein